MKPSNKSSLRKKAAALVALLALMGLAVGGTFAYQDYKQHKSNEFNGLGKKYEVRLVEDFKEVPDWKVEDGPIKKEIRVTNLGQAAAGYGNIYVRLQLKEFMQIGDVTYIESEKRYMIDEEGQFITFASENTAKTAYPEHNVKQMTDYVTGKTGWFIETQSHDPNGQYGKHVLLDIVIGDAAPVIPGSTFVPEDKRNHHGYIDQTSGEFVTRSDECDYPTHYWDYAGGLHVAPYIEEYIQWGLNEGSIIRLSDWDGKPVAKWILDDSADGGGWAYWGQPLYAVSPGAKSTTDNLLNTVRLIQQPDGNFYYVIHTDMEAASLDEFFKDGGNGWNKKIEDSYRDNAPRIEWLGSTPAEVEVGETVASPGVKVYPEEDDQDGLVWTSSNPAIASVDENGVVTGHKPGKATITARAKNGATASYVIEVKGDSGPTQPQEISVTGVNLNASTKTLEPGGAFQLVATILPADATNKSVTWESSNPAVATVDANGNVTAVSPGTATITVATADGGFEKTCVVTVDTGIPPELPVKNGEGPYGMVGSDTLSLHYGLVYVVDLYGDFDNPQIMDQHGTIKLKDILNGTDFSGITVSSADPAVNSKIKIIEKDRDDDAAIEIRYYGTQQQWIDELAAWDGTGNRPYPQVQVTLVLHKAGFSETTIKVNLAFNGSLIA